MGNGQWAMGNGQWANKCCEITNRFFPMPNTSASLRDATRTLSTSAPCPILNAHQCPMPNAPCPILNAPCPMPHAQCPMPNAQCPMPHAHFHHYLVYAIQAGLLIKPSKWYHGLLAIPLYPIVKKHFLFNSLHF
jgi:hypothetical protein